MNSAPDMPLVVAGYCLRPVLEPGSHRPMVEIVRPGGEAYRVPMSALARRLEREREQQEEECHARHVRLAAALLGCDGMMLMPQVGPSRVS